ncbi:MAG TPA: glycosyltransferase [Reyranella sp.]|nr:glycosyltransferase [Reyranella sp.]
MSGRIALVSSHFAPSNLVGGHRARLWSRYLPEFGWEPIVVTGDPAHYEERPDPDLERLIAPGLEVVHAATLPTRPVRLVGDVGVRAFWGCYRAVARLVRQQRIDFVLVTIPSNFLAPLGRLIHWRYGVPFGIDYQDPWVNAWPGVERKGSRAWWSYTLATWLEPWSVRDAALITGMAPGYVAGMLERNPHVARKAVVASMPMGSASEDFELVTTLHRAPFLFDPADGNFHMIYAGALLPAGIVVLDAFLAGLRALREAAPAVAARLRVHFVGTGSSPDDPNGHRVLPRARDAGVTDMVDEHPHRIGYVDTLNHLEHCSAVLVLGSTERHYTPSKVFQAILSKRPVFAMLHAESTAIGMIETARTGRVLPLTAEAMPRPEAVAAGLEALVGDPPYDSRTVDGAAFEFLSARASTRALADALDQACARAGR